MDGYKAKCGTCSAELVLIRTDRLLTFLPEDQRQAALDSFKTISIEGLNVTLADENGHHVCPSCCTPATLTAPNAENN